ncbi:selenoprotein [Patagioenas fasciata monilis]|uniref:Selenoprotein F n=1 Tax=Patagioenas fasciata monilis TaxID=372326 RepID=A0A1V4JZ51_PATFA|nr:selenoprotein [Patagioenas fasciata monilis]
MRPFVIGTPFLKSRPPSTLIRHRHRGSWERQNSIAQISVYGAQLSSEACRELGFSSNLLCSSCNLLGQFNLNQLDPFCRQCCQEEAQLETRKLYAGAVLENIHKVAPLIGGLSFVRSDKPKLFRGLQIKYVRGSDPVLKLLDDNGNIAEELSILKWNTDSVEEFLSEKLERL